MEPASKIASERLCTALERQIGSQTPYKYAQLLYEAIQVDRPEQKKLVTFEKSGHCVLAYQMRGVDQGNGSGCGSKAAFEVDIGSGSGVGAVLPTGTTTMSGSCSYDIVTSFALWTNKRT